MHPMNPGTAPLAPLGPQMMDSISFMLFNLNLHAKLLSGLLLKTVRYENSSNGKGFKTLMK